MLENIDSFLKKIKHEKPLVLNITNDVTMDFIANGLLSLGASPVMSKAKQEMEDLVGIAQSVVLNLGTLDEPLVALCEYACQLANQMNKPIVLDPVGAGASRYRTRICQKLIQDYRISIIRGNASEVMALAGGTGTSKGVDSTADSSQAIQKAQALSAKYDTCVFISGKIDIIVSAQQISQCERGSYLMPMVTGTGCLLSAVVSAFHAVEKDPFVAAGAAALFYGICGEVAAEKASAPGSFKVAFMDALNAT